MAGRGERSGKEVRDDEGEMKVMMTMMTVVAVVRADKHRAVTLWQALF